MAEEPGSHRSGREIEHLEERNAFVARSERLDQLQVAAGHLVEPEESVRPPDRRPIQVRKAARLEVGDVAEQTAGRADRGPVVGTDAEAVERGKRKPATELFARELRVELPPVSSGHHETGVERTVGVERGYHLGGPESAEHFLQAAVGTELQRELTGRQVDRRDADVGIAGIDRDQKVVLAAGDPAFFEQRPRGDRLDDFAPDDSLGLLRILDLFADRDAVAAADQLPEVLGRGFGGHAGERHSITSGGQRDVQDPRRELGVVVEHLVEIAHPEKEDRVPVTGLDLPVLQEER